MVEINEAKLKQIVDQADLLLQKEWFGNLEPIDELELRNISLKKIKDLNVYEKEILQNTLYQESSATLHQDLSEWDIISFLSSTINLGVSQTKTDDSIVIAQSSSGAYLGIVVDCWSGLYIDSITINLEKSGSPVGTFTCDLLTDLTPSGSDYTEAGATTAETSTDTYDAVSDITTSYQNFTFNFAGNYYTWLVFFRFGTGNVSGTNFFRVTSGTTSSTTRATTYTVDTSPSPDTWNLDSEYAYFVLEWDHAAGIYKAHWDYYQRTIDPFEVMEDVSTGGTVKLNTSNVFYKQSWLTAGSRYYVDYDWTLTTSATFNPIGYAVNTTTIRQLPPTTNFDIIQDTYSIWSLPSTENYSHTLSKPPRAAIMWAGGQAADMKVGFWDWDTNAVSFDRVYQSSHENTTFIFKDYEAGGWDAIIAEITAATDTQITIDWWEIGAYSDTDAIYFTILLIA